MSKFDLSKVNNRGITPEDLEARGITKELIRTKLTPMLKFYLGAHDYTEKDFEEMSVYEIMLALFAAHDEVKKLANEVREIRERWEELAKADEDDVLTIEGFEKIRKSSHMSQKEMADTFGIPAQTYIQWANGRRNPPDYVLKMMAQMIDLNSDEDYTMRDAIKDSVRAIFNGVDVDPDDTIPCPVDVALKIKVIEQDGHAYVTLGEIDPDDATKFLLYLRRRHIKGDE